MNLIVDNIRLLSTILNFNTLMNFCSHIGIEVYIKTFCDFKTNEQTSPEVSNIFENSDFVYMLNQANGDRQILAKQLNISPHQLSYVTHSGEGEGLLFFGNVILPFVDHFPKDLELYRILTTKLNEISEGTQK